MTVQDGIPTGVNLVLLHGFWSSPRTWDKLVKCFREDAELQGVNIYPIGYESPRIPALPFAPTRIPQYDDVAHTLPAHFAGGAPEGDLVIVTHSQGGLILQRFLAWMITEGRGGELARIRSIIMLACPNEGTEYLRSIRAVLGFGRHPQAKELRALDANVTQARRIVMERVVHATEFGPHQCPIPIHVYAGSTDRIVPRSSAQSVFPNAASLPGNHFTILHAGASGNLTFQQVRRHLLDNSNPFRGSVKDVGVHEEAGRERPKYQVTINGSDHIQVGDHNYMEDRRST